MKSEKDLQTYFVEAASWDADRAAQADRRARLAWWVATAGWLCAIASASAIAFLAPLKTVAPYVIRVDNTTGLVDVVPQYSGTADVPETVTRYLLRHYVDVCERFSWATAESDYEECGAFNSPRRNQAWSAAWARSNPASPLNLYKDGTTILARVVSVSFFPRASGKQDLAQVRFVKIRRMSDSGSESTSHWIGTIQFAYVAPSKDPRVRQWNPLGFRVIEYRADAETPVTPADAPPSEGKGAAS